MPHTKGPWIAAPFSSIVGAPIVSTSTGRSIATVRYFDIDEESIANAHLIAAAPDLLEALEMVRDADNDLHSEGLITLPGVARMKIDAAIAKAKGEVK